MNNSSQWRTYEFNEEHDSTVNEVSNDQVNVSSDIVTAVYSKFVLNKKLIKIWIKME